MGEALGKLFVPLESLPGLYSLPSSDTTPKWEIPPDAGELNPTFGGVCQLFFLAAVYGYILFQASNMISNGSELLLLIPSAAPLVGSVVLPILGAVPDGAIVLFSGLGGSIEEAQDNLDVGVGALAGSTIMLLTIPWTLAVIAGRVDINDGVCSYRKPKLDGKHAMLSETGVQPTAKALKGSGIWMVLTSLSYVVIQGSAFAFQGVPSKPTNDILASDESPYALVGLIVSLICFFAYLYYQVKESRSNQVLKDVVDSKREEAVKMGLLSLSGVFFEALEKEGVPLGSTESTSLISTQSTEKDRFKALVGKFFHKYDRDGNGEIDREEFKVLLHDLRITLSAEEENALMSEMDADGSGQIVFSEFVDGILQVVKGNTSDLESVTPTYGTETSGNTATHSHVGHSLRSDDRRLSQLYEHGKKYHSGESSNTISLDKVNEEEDDDEEEEESVPDDLAHLPPDQQQRRIIARSFRLMIVGTLAVLLFSDPMVSVLSELGNVIHVPAFYVSFVLAPLASNASELISAYNYAAKKTTKTVTISLNTLQGAAIMNNTFCLGIFLALIYLRGMKWIYSAETISIIVVQMIIVVVSFRKVQTVRLALGVLALFPLSLFAVAILENVFGLDNF